MLQSLFYLFMFTSSVLAFQYSSALLPHFKYVSKYVMLIYRQWITVVDKCSFKIMQTKRANQFRSAQEQNIADFVRLSLVFGFWKTFFSYDYIKNLSCSSPISRMKLMHFGILKWSNWLTKFLNKSYYGVYSMPGSRERKIVQLGSSEV